MIPKTTNLARLPENLKSTEVTLDVEDMRRLREGDKKFRRFKVLKMFWKAGEDIDFWDTEADEKFVIPSK